MVYNKLVRDKITDLIEANGETPYIRILSDEEYTDHLERKLDEEVGEYHKEKNLEELADILEVVFALADNMGYSRDELMDVYQKKNDQRGGFQRRILLLSKES